MTRACPGTLALIRHPRRRFYWSHILYNAYLQCTNHHSPCTTRSILHTVRLSPTDRTRMQRACIDRAPDSDPAHAPAAHPHARLGQEMRIAPALASRRPRTSRAAPSEGCAHRTHRMRANGASAREPQGACAGARGGQRGAGCVVGMVRARLVPREHSRARGIKSVPLRVAGCAIS